MASHSCNWRTCTFRECRPDRSHSTRSSFSSTLTSCNCNLSDAGSLIYQLCLEKRWCFCLGFPRLPSFFLLGYQLNCGTLAAAFCTGMRHHRELHWQGTHSRAWDTYYFCICNPCTPAGSSPVWRSTAAGWWSGPRFSPWFTLFAPLFPWYPSPYLAGIDE